MPTKSKQGSTVNPKLPNITRKHGLKAVELLGQAIFQVEGLLSVEECDAFVQFAEKLGFQHQSSRGASFGEAHRDNGRTSISSKETADLLWRGTGLRDILAQYPQEGQEAIGLNPNIRFYKYVAGNKFGKHVDDSVKVGDDETKYTLLVYLSGGREANKAAQPLTGGETVFYGGRKSRLLVSVKPRPGLALLHLHGDDCLEHEGAEVRQGVKYVLRSDVVYA